MAKRKRLTVPAFGGFAAPPPPEAKPALGPGLAPAPISRVTGEAAATAALREVAEELTSARTEGRLVLRIDLDRIEEGWLVRDRLGIDAEELDSLMTSLAAHGQLERGQRGLGQRGRVGEAPVFIAPSGQAEFHQPGRRGRPRRQRHVRFHNPFGKGGHRHHATSARRPE